MDSINVERIHGLKRYKQQQFMKTLMFYPILILTCVIFCTSPFWFHSIYSSIKDFLCDSIPTILSFFFNAKSLFILGNLIVIFLLGESKIQTSDNSSSLPRKIEAEQDDKKKEKEKKTSQIVKFKKDDELKIVAMELKEKSRQVEEEKESDFDHDDDKEEIENCEESKMEKLFHELTTAELNRRADYFIARVNQQIRFEAEHEVLLCSY